MIEPIPLRKLNDEQNPSTIAACFIASDATSVVYFMLFRKGVQLSLSEGSPVAVLKIGEGFFAFPVIARHTEGSEVT